MFRLSGLGKALCGGVLFCLIFSPTASAQNERMKARMEKMLKQFPEADVDRDGKLTLKELKAFRSKQNPDGKKKEQPKRDGSKEDKSNRVRPNAMMALYEAKTFEGVPYRYLEPLDVSEGDKTFPIVLTLHGAGGRGDDNRKNLKVFNGVLASQEMREKYPCFVIAPQSKTGWSIPGTVKYPTPEELASYPPQFKEGIIGKHFRNPNPADEDDMVLDHVFNLIDELIETKTVDPNRIYVLGHSMGGAGTWEAIAQQPDRFAAAIPSAGALKPWQDPAKIKHIPIWSFHGSNDKVVVPEHSRHVFAAMKKIGGNMKYTDLGGVSHSSEKTAFNYKGDRANESYKTHLSSEACDPTEDVWEWLFRQKKK